MEFRYFFKSLCAVGILAALLTACAGSPDSGSLRVRATTGNIATNVGADSHQSLANLPGNPSLSDYLQVAALNNPGLEAAFNQWKAALELIPQVRALPDPKFTYGYFIEQVETRVGPQRQRFGLVQTFPWFGKLRLKGDRAGEHASAAKEGYEQAKLKLFYEVKYAYYELSYLRQAISLTEENIELVKHLESVAQAKFRAGSDVTGVVKSQVELGKLEDKLSTLQDLREPISSQLNASLNRETSTFVPWPEVVMSSVISIADDAVFGILLAASPELKQMAALIRESERSVELAKKAFYPDLTLGVDYVDTQDAFFPGVVDSGKDPLMVMGSINIPIWLGKNRAGVKEAEAKRSAARASLENRGNVLISDLKMLLYRFRDAERKIDLFGGTLAPLAKNSLDVTEQAYQAGRSDFLELIDAQRLLLDIQLSYQRAVADREQRLAQIEMMIGGPTVSESGSASN
jgi:outer membrane protein, heavy metal efflux system